MSIPRRFRPRAAPTKPPTHAERRENDEIVCRCGLRWPVGESHP